MGEISSLAPEIAIETGLKMADSLVNALATEQES